MIKNFDFKVYEFLDVDGNKRELRGCPLNQLPIFKQAIQTLWVEMGKYPNVAISDLYHQNDMVRLLTNKCLMLCGLRTEWLNINMMIQLLHQYQSEDSLIHKGLLIEQNLPQLMYESESQKKEAGQLLALHKLVKKIQSETNH